MKSILNINLFVFIIKKKSFFKIHLHASNKLKDKITNAFEYISVLKCFYKLRKYSLRMECNKHFINDRYDIR